MGNDFFMYSMMNIKTRYTRFLFKEHERIIQSIIVEP